MGYIFSLEVFGKWDKNLGLEFKKGGVLFIFLKL